MGRRVGMKPVAMLKANDLIQPKRDLTDQIIKHWKYAADCASVEGGLLKDATLTIVETSAKPGAAWAKAQPPRRSPPAYLKIAGEELSLQFDLLA